ncbi:MAG: hypothetical protein AAGK09_06960 [Planctomycetota bacterium]
MIRPIQSALVIALAPAALTHADSLLGQRLIDLTVNDNQGPPYSAFFQISVGEGGLSLFTIELDETTSPGTIYNFASAADAVNYPFIVNALTDGITESQFANFQLLESGGASFPVDINDTEQGFFGLTDPDFAGETISKIEFEVFDYETDLIAAPAIGSNGSPVYEINFSGAIRVFGPGDDNGTPTVVPTPTAAALGLIGLVAVVRRRRSVG